MCDLDTKIITLMFSLKKSINYNPNNIVKLYMFTMDWVQVQDQTASIDKTYLPTYTYQLSLLMDQI